jgi:hypothetical protein
MLVGAVVLLGLLVVIPTSNPTANKDTATATTLERVPVDKLLLMATNHKRAHEYQNAYDVYVHLLDRHRSSSDHASPSSSIPEGLLDEAAAMARKNRQHDAAYELHHQSLTEKGKAGATAGTFLICYTELVTDKYLGFHFDGALSVLEMARTHLKDAMSEEATGLLFKIEVLGLQAAMYTTITRVHSRTTTRTHTRRLCSL